MTRLDRVVVDASVVVEYLVDLALTEQATLLFRRLDDADPIELWAPDLLHVEIASALRKLVRRKAISARDGERSLRNLLRLPLCTTGMAGILLDAWKIRDRVTPYDAMYLLLARELDAPLVTADIRLARAAPRGINVLLLQDWSRLGEE